jgi:hypothetical protein
VIEEIVKEWCFDAGDLLEGDVWVDPGLPRDCGSGIVIVETDHGRGTLGVGMAVDFQ